MNRIEETSATLKSGFSNVDKAKKLLESIDSLLSDLGYEVEYSLNCYDNRKCYGDDSPHYLLMATIYDKGKPGRPKK